MSAPRYVVIDLRGGGLMGWTRDMPQTKQQLRSYLYQMANDGKSKHDRWRWATTTLDDYLEMFGLAIVRAA